MDARTSFAGRYRILDRLGEGGMSVVWRAHDPVLDRVVAIKMLAPGQLVDAAARARVQTEARAAAALSHPNVAAVHDYGETPDPSGEPVPYVVMELVDGVPLTDVLADGPVDRSTRCASAPT
jgi:eukaryotic-like serine/threonine-protein kinase